MLRLTRLVRSFATLSVVVVAACSSSNFDVASGAGGDSGSNDDASQGGDSTGMDTTIEDTGGAPGDSANADVPVPGDGKADGTAGDSIGGDASTCPGTLCAPATGGAPMCVDLNTDSLNCGACDKAVCHTEVCVSRTPACSPGYLECGGPSCLGCRNRNDAESCGGCTKKCVAGELCIDGSCTLATTCPSGTEKCTGTSTISGGCFDTQNDIGHCGACDVACSPGQYCAKGSCVSFTSAPGCSSCPCAACTGKFGNCCPYAGHPVCAEGDCPGG